VRLVQGQMGHLLADHAARADRGYGGRRRVSKARVYAMLGMKKIDVAAIEAARRG
jgi:hypothetical protein